MLTKLTIRNFKLLEEVEIALDNGVVFIGPNNSGKTSAIQALSLWHDGLKKWANRRAPKNALEIPEKRYGVTVNRLELISLPISEIDLIWRNRKVRSKPNENIRIELIVDGISDGKEWKCGLEFDYGSPEVLYCRPLRVGNNPSKRMRVPPEALKTRLAFLPPMSGLASEEALIQEGRINVLIGQGRTAEVIRNLCYRVCQKNAKEDWNSLVGHIKNLFGVTLNPPEYDENRGTIEMNYQETNSKTKFDLPSSGRGMHQVLLLLAYMYDNDHGAVLLLDEPDAHLEILRQRQIYSLLVKVAREREAQIIAASHSSVLLNEAAQRETAIAFVGKPHKLTKDKVDEVLKSLNEVGFEYYHYAEIKGWILYLEGESDLSILKEFAIFLEHPAKEHLQTPLVKYLCNDRPNDARRHFYALREAKKDLVGMLLMDRLKHGDTDDEPGLKKTMWRQKEIENYLCNRKALVSFVNERLNDDLFGRPEKKDRTRIMEAEIRKLEDAISTLGKPKAFSEDIKASDDFLTPLFQNFSKKVTPLIPEESPQILRKRDFYLLVKHIPKDEIDQEVIEKLDAIVEVAQSAMPREA